MLSLPFFLPLTSLTPSFFAIRHKGCDRSPHYVLGNRLSCLYSFKQGNFLLKNHLVVSFYSNLEKLPSDKDKRPRNCIACAGDHIIIRGHQYHDMEDIGTPTIKRILRHEKITWECKDCGTKFMLINPDVPYDTEYTDDVKTYALKRVLDRGDASNRVAADLRELHNVEVTPQAICDWVKREREKILAEPAESVEEGEAAEEPAEIAPARV